MWGMSLRWSVGAGADMLCGVGRCRGLEPVYRAGILWSSDGQLTQRFGLGGTLRSARRAGEDSSGFSAAKDIRIEVMRFPISVRVSLQSRAAFQAV